MNQNPLDSPQPDAPRHDLAGEDQHLAALHEHGLSSYMPHGRGDIFFAAVERTRMPMIVTDPHKPDNPIIFANDAFIRMTGYSAVEILGRNCRLLQGPETDRTQVAQIREAIEARHDISLELLNYRKDGSPFWNNLFISPVFDQEGSLVYFFASQLDVSRRRDAEDALRQAQKMEALGQLTGGIAHDFNNLLQVMVGQLTLLNLQLGKTDIPRDKALRHAQSTRVAVDKATVLTQQLLAFSRKQRLEGRPVNLDFLLQGMRDMIGDLLGDRFPLTVQGDPQLGTCIVDPVQTEVSITNLLLNARDAMPQGGPVVLQLAEVRGEQPMAGAWGVLEDKAYLRLSVKDSGSGIDPDILPRVVDPFFSTKEEGKGTGLGLSMVYGFVKQSGGAMRIESVPGRGTTVHLYFPVAGTASSPLATLPAQREGPRGTGSVLVVDDRPEVAELAGLMLEELGYQVNTVIHSSAALALLAGEQPFDLLFTDVIMPGNMNGVMLAREALRLRPKIHILLTTGFADASLGRRADGNSEFALIQKPYGFMELGRKVREVLDSGRAA